jgi:putative ABC transport system substrate-binding protein
MKRRHFVGLLGAVAALGPFAARAQQPMPLIGFLSARSSSDQPFLALFPDGLADFGYIEGRNVAIEFRGAEGQYDRLPALAADLVERQVNVIVAVPDPAALAAKAATRIIPIVFIVGVDPVKFGLVESLNRPGGNLTGVSGLMGALAAKQIGLLHQLVPNATSVAFLLNPNEPSADSQISDGQAAAGAIGNQLVILKAANEQEIAASFEVLSQQRVGALLVAQGPFFVAVREKLVALAARYSIPAMFFRREFAESGGLISYGASPTEVYRQLGVYAGRILKGTKPADLPVVEPTKLELVINLKAARALGLSVPNSLMATADEVIE